MVMSIWSFASANKAYSLLKKVKGDYEIHIDVCFKRINLCVIWTKCKQKHHPIQHWESLPIINVHIVSEQESCPSDSETPIWAPSDRNALHTIGRFPGSLNWCECGAGPGFLHTFTYTQYQCVCGTGCIIKDDKSYCSNSMGDGACYPDQQSAGCRTNTQPASMNQWWSTQSGLCSTNATLAGCADDIPADPVELPLWRNDNKLCFERGGWTAMERIENLDIGTATCSRGVTCEEGDGQEPSTTICAPTQDECPIVDLGDLELGMDISGTGLNSLKTGPGLPIIEVQTTIGSPCWKGTWGQPGRANNKRVANKFEQSCTEPDTRFVEWDRVTESDLYQMNDVGTSGGVYMVGDGTNSDIQRYDTNSNVEWKLSYRREIEWDSTCAAGNIGDLVENLKPLKKVVDYQYQLV